MYSFGIGIRILVLQTIRSGLVIRDLDSLREVIILNLIVVNVLKKKKEFLFFNLRINRMRLRN